MEKLYLFVAKYKWLAIIVFAAVGGIFFALGDINWGRGIVYAVYVLLVWFVCSQANQLAMSPAVRKLNEKCDPFPLLYVTEKLKSVKVGAMQGFVIALNYCVALLETGEREKAYSELKKINVDAIPNLQPTFKLIYYFNLSGVCMALNRYGEADEYYAKTLVLLGFVKNEKQKENLKIPMLIAGAEEAFRNGRMDEAEKLLLAVLSDGKATNRTRVTANELLADISVFKGQIADAENRLCYVITYGNKLFAVPEAKYKIDCLRK